MSQRVKFTTQVDAPTLDRLRRVVLAWQRDRPDLTLATATTEALDGWTQSDYSAGIVDPHHPPRVRFSTQVDHDVYESFREALLRARKVRPLTLAAATTEALEAWLEQAPEGNYSDGISPPLPLRRGRRLGRGSGPTREDGSP